MIRTLALLTAALAAAPCLAAQTQSYPVKPVRMILSYPPGGATDTLGRLIARPLSETWGVPVVADNRAGAGGNIGTTLCTKSPPDGYTMCLVAVAQTMTSRVLSSAGFDSLKDFSHVTMIASMPMLLLVHPSLPVKNVSDLIALAKKKPGALNYASSGGGASHHLAMELFKQQAGVDLVLITYKGGGGAQVTDQIAGRVEVAFNLAVGVIPFVKEGKLRAIGVSTKERFPGLPNVPTIDESGLKGFDATSWQGLSMPAGSPPDIVHRVSADVSRILKTPEIRARILDMGGVAVGSSPEEFSAFFRAESDKWLKVAKAANVKFE